MTSTYGTCTTYISLYDTFTTSRTYSRLSTGLGNGRGCCFLICSTPSSRQLGACHCSLPVRKLCGPRELHISSRVLFRWAFPFAGLLEICTRLP